LIGPINNKDVPIGYSVDDNYGKLTHCLMKGCVLPEYNLFFIPYERDLRYLQLIDGFDMRVFWQPRNEVFIYARSSE
jgi:hypothetical protein